MSQFCFRCETPIGMWTIDEAFDWFWDHDDEDRGFESALNLIESRNWPLELDYCDDHAEFRLPVYGAWADGNKRLTLQVCADCQTYYAHLKGFDVTRVLHRVAS